MWLPPLENAHSSSQQKPVLRMWTKVSFSSGEKCATRVSCLICTCVGMLTHTPAKFSREWLEMRTKAPSEQKADVWCVKGGGVATTQSGQAHADAGGGHPCRSHGNAAEVLFCPACSFKEKDLLKWSPPRDNHTPYIPIQIHQLPPVISSYILFPFLIKRTHILLVSLAKLLKIRSFSSWLFPSFNLLPFKIFFGYPLFFSLPGYLSSWSNYRSLPFL